MKVLIIFFSESPNSEYVDMKENKKGKEQYLFFALDDNFSIMLVFNFYTFAFYLTSFSFVT